MPTYFLFQIIDLQGRFISFRCSEGLSIVGVIGTELRACAAEKSIDPWENPTLEQLGYSKNDITGTYFSPDDFAWVSNYDPNNKPALTFMVTCIVPENIREPGGMVKFTLDHDGNWHRYKFPLKWYQKSLYYSHRFGINPNTLEGYEILESQSGFLCHLLFLIWLCSSKISYPSKVLGFMPKRWL